MKLEIGGGRNPRGEGFINLDIIETADIQFDLERLSDGVSRLPVENDSVDEVYSCHCLEHLTRFWPVMFEILRACKLGAPVLIRVPHWLHQHAMSAGHKQVISDHQVRNELCQNYERHFKGRPRRFELVKIHYEPEIYLDEIRGDFPEWSDEKIMRFIPGTCHEVYFYLKVIENV